MKAKVSIMNINIRLKQGRIERRGHATPIQAVKTAKSELLLKIAVSGINNIRRINGI